MIRRARPADLPRLAHVEAAAEALFADTPMAWVANLPKGPVATIIPDHVRIWVSVDEHDMPLGFLEAEPMGGWLHILELSVHPAGQRQGRARALLARAAAHAREHRLERLSLTTDRLIAFNGPMYQRMGFHALTVDALPDWLADIMAREIAAGFDPARRVAMVRCP